MFRLHFARCLSRVFFFLKYLRVYSQMYSFSQDAYGSG